MTLKSRVIPCLDVKDGRVVKGVNFVDLMDAGDPVEAAKAYDAAGADELTFLDITASSDNRDTIFPTLWNKSSQIATCHHCLHTDETEVKKKLGMGTCVVACCLCLMGGCCWVPFLLPIFKDTLHSCSKCKTVLGCRTFA